jgi:hypothetical protein
MSEHECVVCRIQTILDDDDPPELSACMTIGIARLRPIQLCPTHEFIVTSAIAIAVPKEKRSTQ